MNPACYSKLLFRLSVLTIAVCAHLGAEVLMVDFGGTAVGSGAAQTNSPYHTANGSFTEDSWNSHGQSSDSTLLWADGTAAAGVGTRTFKGNAGSSALAAAGWSSSFSGSAVNTGVYQSPSVGIDGYMMTGTFSDERSIGLQVYGLAAGLYEVYIVGRNTNYAAAEYTLNYYADAGNNTSAFDFAAYDSASVTFAGNAADKTSAWVFDALNPSVSNYVKLNVTLTGDNPYLNIGTIGDDVNGVFNAIQIVAIPEPSSLVLMVGAIGFILISSRRFRKSA